MNVADAILARADDRATALIAPDVVWTFAQLRKRVHQTAGALLHRGHGKGARIGLFAENSPFFVSTYLGIIRAGLAVVPLQTDLTAATLAQMASDSGMSELVVSKRFDRHVRGWADNAQLPILTQVELENLSPVPFPAIPEIVPTQDLAALMFTSGSTGKPKGVMVSHRNIECNTRDIVSYLGLQATDRVMVVLPFHYCFGLSLLHSHLMAGASLVLNSNFRIFPEQMLLEMQEHQCTGLAGVPSTYQILLRKTRFRQLSFPNLRWFQQAGGKLPNACIQELRESFPQVRFYLMYGQTEGTARLSYLPPERLGDKLGSIGQGLPSTKLQVLKADGTPVLPGSTETGEIVATGENIALGYWKDPVETAKFFKNGRLYTGDLARVDEDGFIYFVERERDFLKPGGNRVSAREIEDVIAEIPEVVEVAVVGAPNELLGEAIHAFVVLRSDAGMGPEDILKHCRKRLAPSKTPHEITVLSSLPHNAAGKVLKPKLRAIAASDHQKTLSKPAIVAPAATPAAIPTA